MIERGGVMAVEVEIDVELLKSEIKRTYASVSGRPQLDNQRGGRGRPRSVKESLRQP